jgi:hypothetical protein
MKTSMKRPDVIRKGFKIAGLFAAMLMALCVTMGLDADSGVVYSATGVAGVTGGTAGAAISGQEVSTETVKDASANILEDSVSTKITECFKDQATLFYILDKVAKEKMNTKNGTFSRVHRFYQVGQRPVKGVVTTGYNSMTTGGSPVAKNLLKADLIVDDASVWTKDSVVYPRTAAGAIVAPGYDYSSGAGVAKGSLQLIVVDVNKGSNTITVQATNALRTTPGNPATAYLPTIPDGTVLIRLAPLGSETDAQAVAYHTVPEDTMNFVATFHTQYEVTPDYLKHGKEINWGETQIKDQVLSDFLDGIEKTLLVGQRAEFVDVVDDDKKYQMGGFLYFNDGANDFEYEIDNATKEGLTGKDLNELMAHTFAGNNGSKTRIMLMGSGFARRAQLLNDTQKWSTKMTPKQQWGFEFTGITNLFGSLDSLLYTQLDELGMEEYAIILDLRNISLVEAEGLAVRALDLKGAGVKNVDASYITRKLTFELRNPKTHVLVKPKFV